MSRSYNEKAKPWEIEAVFAIPRTMTRFIVGHIASQAYDIHRGRGYYSERRLGNTPYFATRTVVGRPDWLGIVKQVDMTLYPSDFALRSWDIGGSVLSATSTGRAFVNGERAHAIPFQPATITTPEVWRATWLAAEGLGRLAVANAIALGTADSSTPIDLGRLPALTTFWKAVYARGLMDQKPGTFPTLSNVTPDYRILLNDLLPDVPPDFGDFVRFQSPIPSAE